MKVNNPLEVKKHFFILNEKHKDQIFKLCDKQNIHYATKTVDRWIYPVEVKRIDKYYRSFLTFGWKEL